MTTFSARPNRDLTMMKSSQNFEDALVYATHLHRDQKRKGSDVPYVAHLLAVCSIAIEHGATEEQAIAALLHDAIEDQGGDPTRQEIKRRFGEAVTEIVDGCTDAEVIPKPPWRKRKEQYIAHLAEASTSIRLVSAADKLHNLRSIVADYRELGDDLWGRFNGKKDGTLWYYRTLASVFRGRGPETLSNEIDIALAELETLIDTQ